MGCRPASGEGEELGRGLPDPLVVRQPSVAIFVKMEANYWSFRPLVKAGGPGVHWAKIDFRNYLNSTRMRTKSWVPGSAAAWRDQV